ncbi:MAG: domain S-box protein [Parcubacteria group bacterium]|nr:domain S-box protein [Parcubacteria group bacterium]
MSIRTLLGILFVTSLAIIFGFIAVILWILWFLMNNVIPELISFGGVTLAAPIVLAFAGFLLFSLITLLFSFLYLLIDRLIVQPMKHITAAMHEFAEHNHQVPLPPFSRTTNEVRWMAEVFTEFTNSVEEVHRRDMEVSRMKSDFISTAAHQLRTPMTGIRWALEALQKTPVTPDQQVLVDSAVGKSHDLVTIIGTLLDISSIESGKYRYQFEAVDMDGVLEEIVRDFTPMAQTRAISLYYEKNEVPLGKARADRERIKWVLNNLVENALRYTPSGGSVRVSMDGGVGHLFLRVKDTGIGIKAGDRSSIFERFYRAQNAIQKENAGNGLGLYIARTIATDHGGDLNFEPNKDGPGTTFTVSLPLAV